MSKPMKQVKGLNVTAMEMALCDTFWIKTAAGRFISDRTKSEKTIDSIRQTAQTAARSLRSEQVRHDLGKPGPDWSQLTREPVTVYIIPPSEEFTKSGRG